MWYQEISVPCSDIYQGMVERCKVAALMDSDPLDNRGYLYNVLSWNLIISVNLLLVYEEILVQCTAKSIIR